MAILQYRKIKIKDRNNNTYLGTGTLISSNIVLTCAHNVYDLEYKYEYSNIEFFPALNDGVYLHSSKVKKICYPEEYTKYHMDNEYRFQYDYAILFLEENYEDNYGYFGIKIHSDEMIDSEFSLYGYPGDKEFGTQLWGMEGTVQVTDSLYTYNTIDTSGGQSGSALFKKNNEAFYISGIHVAADYKNYNKAVIINSERFFNILKWTQIETETNTLNLSSNSIGDEGMRHFATINLPQLKELYLKENSIGDEGMRYIVTMNLPQLNTLYLKYNSIGDKGIRHLAKMNSPQLVYLYLEHNSIGAQEKKKLRKIFEKTSNLYL